MPRSVLIMSVLYFTVCANFCRAHNDVALLPIDNTVHKVYWTRSTEPPYRHTVDLNSNNMKKYKSDDGGYMVSARHFRSD